MYISYFLIFQPNMSSDAKTYKKKITAFNKTLVNLIILTTILYSTTIHNN